MTPPVGSRASTQGAVGASAVPSPLGNVAVIVPAAGLGSRMGGVTKTFLELDGVPVLLRSIRPFLSRDDVVEIVIALAPGDAAAPPAWLVEDPRVRIVSGGDTRTESVRAALDGLPTSATIIVVHDGARPLVTADVIDRCIAQVRDGRAAVAGYRAIDTIKRVDGQDRVVDTPDRKRLWHAQTPQAFPRMMIEAAYAQDRGTIEVTDDAALAEAAGFEIVMIESTSENLKVTYLQDLALANFILNSRLS